MEPKNPMKVSPKESDEPFDRQAAEDHFLKTGQASDELFGTSGIGEREGAA